MLYGLQLGMSLTDACNVLVLLSASCGGAICGFRDHRAQHSGMIAISVPT
jgi:hypothetical protein